MKEMAETPYAVCRYPFARGAAQWEPGNVRPATVAEARHAVTIGRWDSSKRIMGEWYFGFYAGQEPEQVEAWLARHAPEGSEE